MVSRRDKKADEGGKKENRIKTNRNSHSVSVAILLHICI